MQNFNSVEHAQTMITADQASIESKTVLFQQAVDYFGVDALRPKTGLRGQAMQASAKRETKQKAASEVGLTLEMAEELTAMIALINANRVNVYQDYQRAYFGTPEKIEKVKTPEEIEIAAQKKTRSDLLATNKTLAEKAALIKAEKKVLESQGKALPAERVVELEKVEALKKGVKAKTDALKERIEHMTFEKDLPSIIKKTQDFKKFMAKHLKQDENTVGQMSLNGILKALESE